MNPEEKADREILSAHKTIDNDIDQTRIETLSLVAQQTINRIYESKFIIDPKVYDLNTEKEETITHIKDLVLELDIFVVYASVEATLRLIEAISLNSDLITTEIARFHMICHILFICATRDDWFDLYSYASKRKSNPNHTQKWHDGMGHDERRVCTMAHKVTNRKKIGSKQKVVHDRSSQQKNPAPNTSNKLLKQSHSSRDTDSADQNSQEVPNGEKNGSEQKVDVAMQNVAHDRSSQQKNHASIMRPGPWMTQKKKGKSRYRVHYECIVHTIEYREQKLV